MQCRRSWFNSWIGKVCWRRDRLPPPVFLGFPCDSAGKESARIVGDLGLIPGLGRSPGEGKDYPLQYSSLEKSQGERSLAGYRPWNLKELDTTKHLSTVAAETTLGNLPLRSQFISSKYHTRDHRPIFTCSSEWSISLSKVTQVRDD